MKVLLIDNYDSFTYNLLHLIRSVCDKRDGIDVIYNDRISAGQAENYDCIVISPGPGIPSEAGNLMNIIKELSPKIPILGICLGHLAVAQVFGGEIYCGSNPAHGIKSRVEITDRSDIFRGLGEYVFAGRYHSWLVRGDLLPDCFKITAVDEKGGVMAISHRNLRLHGLQFHPESVMTEGGELILRNFLYGEQRCMKS